MTGALRTQSDGSWVGNFARERLWCGLLLFKSREGADTPAGFHLVPLWFGELSGWASVAKETAAGETGVA